MTIGQELLKELETETRNVLEIPSEWLPENYRGKRKTRKLSSVYNQLKRSDKNFDRDPRAIRGSAERQAVLARYAKMAEQNLQLEFEANEDNLYNKQATFCGAMILAGVMDKDDFDE